MLFEFFEEKKVSEIGNSDSATESQKQAETVFQRSKISTRKIIFVI